MNKAGDHVEANERERERLRALIERLTDDDLARKVDERWTVADVLGHIAFWDARALYLASKLEGGEPFVAGEHEPEDVDWINESAWPLIREIPARQAARLALRLAEETDSLVARVDAAKCWPAEPSSPLNPRRATHRGEHLDQIEQALGN